MLSTHFQVFIGLFRISLYKLVFHNLLLSPSEITRRLWITHRYFKLLQLLYTFILFLTIYAYFIITFILNNTLLVIKSSCGLLHVGSFIVLFGRGFVSRQLLESVLDYGGGVDIQRILSISKCLRLALNHKLLMIILSIYLPVNLLAITIDLHWSRHDFIHWLRPRLVVAEQIVLFVVIYYFVYYARWWLRMIPQCALVLLHVEVRLINIH